MDSSNRSHFSILFHFVVYMIEKEHYILIFFNTTVLMAVLALNLTIFYYGIQKFESREVMSLLRLLLLTN